MLTLTAKATAKAKTDDNVRNNTTGTRNRNGMTAKLQLVLLGLAVGLVMRPTPIFVMQEGAMATVGDFNRRTQEEVHADPYPDDSSDERDDYQRSALHAVEIPSQVMIQKEYQPRWPQWHGTPDSVLLRDLIQSGTRIEVDQYNNDGDDANAKNRTETDILGTSSTDPKPATYLFNDTQKCEAPPQGVATVVTAYYDMASKHPTHQYREWFDKMLQATDPMVVFIDPNSEWKQFVLDRRRHAPTIVVDYPFANFTMGTRFSDTFWKTEILPRDMEKRFKKGVDVYKIWNEKIIMMQEVAQLNPFDTKHIVWVDAGYFRRKGPAFQPIVRNNLTANGLGQSQIAFQNVFEDASRYTLAGGAWGGTVQAIDHFYTKYFETFWYMALHAIDCIGYEQHVMLVMCHSFPGMCNINLSSHWFAMGQSWLRDPHMSFNRTPFILGRQNRTNLVHGEIRFPSDRVIDSSQDQ